MSNFIQYELWKDCRNNCSFCFNKGQKSIDKIKSLDFVLERLNDEDELKNYNEVGFIGGEFFDNQLENEKIKVKFYKLFDRCKQLIDDNKISKIYITSSLIFSINDYLIPFLNHLKKLEILKYCLLCTSYDLKYRFHTEDKKKLWENNMIMLHDLFPELKLHCETIITGFFIQAVLKNEFNISEFKKRFNTAIDYVEPGSGFYYYNKEQMQKDLPDFFPTKDQVIEFLKKTTIKSKEIDLNTFVSSSIRSDKLYLNYDGERYCVSDRRKSNTLVDIKSLKERYEIGIKDSNETISKYVKIFKETLNDN